MNESLHDEFLQNAHPDEEIDPLANWWKISFIRKTSKATREQEFFSNTSLSEHFDHLALYFEQNDHENARLELILLFKASQSPQLYFSTNFTQNSLIHGIRQIFQDFMKEYNDANEFNNDQEYYLEILILIIKLLVNLTGSCDEYSYAITSTDLPKIFFDLLLSTDIEDIQYYLLALSANLAGSSAESRDIIMELITIPFLIQQSRKKYLKKDVFYQVLRVFFAYLYFPNQQDIFDLISNAINEMKSRINSSNKILFLLIIRSLSFEPSFFQYSLSSNIMSFVLDQLDSTDPNLIRNVLAILHNIYNNNNFIEIEQTIDLRNIFSLLQSNNQMIISNISNFIVKLLNVHSSLVDQTNGPMLVNVLKNNALKAKANTKNHLFYCLTTFISIHPNMLEYILDEQLVDLIMQMLESQSNIIIWQSLCMIENIILYEEQNFRKEIEFKRIFGDYNGFILLHELSSFQNEDVSLYSLKIIEMLNDDKFGE